jgi:outer membrane protein OmpA-like peptidoglycan-associated protein
MKRSNLIGLMLGCLTIAAQAQPVSEYSHTGQEVRIFNTSPVNSEGMEFCPAVYENGLVYVSRYKNGPVDPKTGQTFFELFYAELDPNGMPGKPESFSTELNSAYHEGPVSFSSSGDRIFFTRTNSRNGVRRSDARGRSVEKIYEATRGLFDWENVVELSFNSDEYRSMHPSISADEQQLFFTSDQPNGYGGMDLYVAYWENGQWSLPVNLGPEINTAGNEVFPFHHQSGTLFFSSDGHHGAGRKDLDLYMIDMSGRKWGQVFNMGTPFNSPQDDLGLVILPDGRTGYFSSAREGGFGQDDVYMFKAPLGMQGIRPMPVLSGVVSVTDKTTSRRMTGASIRLFALNKDGLIDDEGAYDLELVPSAVKPGEMIMTMVRKKDENLGSPLMVTDRAGEGIIQLQPDTDYLLLVSKPDYFTQELNFKTDELGPDRPLDFLLEPTNCITLTGTVRSDRFQIPIPGVTLKVTSGCDNTTSICRTNIGGGYEICLPIGCDYLVEAAKPGYENGQTNVTTAKLRGSRSLNADLEIHPTSDAILREPIKEGTVIVLENIYYDFNKSSIRKGAAQDLEALAQLMNLYPSMQIELGSHTDSRGTTEYNQDLSVRRAESAKEFLIQRGITSNRIRTVGYGERILRNHCGDNVNCSDAEHLLNRRTEVKVLNINERVKVTYDEDSN